MDKHSAWLVPSSHCALPGDTIDAMTNLASVLKLEIARVARKEVRAEIESLKKASVHHRSAIAQLRRQVSDLENQLKLAKRQSSTAIRVEKSSASALKYRFKGSQLAAHRVKVGISAKDYGRLVGMSGATIYLWEQDKGKPNAEQVRQLASLRPLGKRAIAARLAALS